MAKWNPCTEEILNKDMVNHPNHYKSTTGIEVIDVIEAFTEDLKGTEAVCTANVIKYICRWRKKNGLEDLKKAQWYLNHLIDYVEESEEQEWVESNEDNPFRALTEAILTKFVTDSIENEDIE